MQIFNLEDREGVWIGEEAFRREVRLFSSPGSSISTEDFALGMTVIEPGQKHEVHIHDSNSEIQVIYEGSGLLVTGNGEEIPVKKGDVIGFLTGEGHGFLNPDGNGSLKILWIYYPPGAADAKFLK